jgi:hypothetical protein
MLTGHKLVKKLKSGHYLKYINTSKPTILKILKKPTNRGELADYVITDYDIALQAVLNNGLNLKHVVANIIDENLITEAIKKNGIVIEYVICYFDHPEFQQSTSTLSHILAITAPISNIFIKSVEKNTTKTDKAYFDLAAKSNGLSLQYFTKYLDLNDDADYKIISNAIDNNPLAIQYVRYIENETDDYKMNALVTNATTKNGLSFKYLKQPFSKFTNIQQIAISQNPDVIKHITHYTDPNMLSKAITTNGMLLNTINKNIVTKDLIFKAVTQNPNIISYVTKYLTHLLTPDETNHVISIALSQKGSLLPEISSVTREHKLIALKQNSSNIKYFNFEQFTHPEWPELFQKYNIPTCIYTPYRCIWNVILSRYNMSFSEDQINQVFSKLGSNADELYKKIVTLTERYAQEVEIQRPRRHGPTATFKSDWAESNYMSESLEEFYNLWPVCKKPQVSFIDLWQNALRDKGNMTVNQVWDEFIADSNIVIILNKNGYSTNIMLQNMFNKYGVKGLITQDLTLNQLWASILEIYGKDKPVNYVEIWTGIVQKYLNSNFTFASSDLEITFDVLWNTILVNACFVVKPGYIFPYANMLTETINKLGNITYKNEYFVSAWKYCLEQDGLNLQYCMTDQLPFFASIAVNNNGNAIMYANYNLIDIYLIRLAYEKNGLSSLEQLPRLDIHKFLSNEARLPKHGKYWQYLAFRISVEKDPNNIRYVNPCFINNRSEKDDKQKEPHKINLMKLIALKHDGKNLRWFINHSELVLDCDYDNQQTLCGHAVLQDPMALEFTKFNKTYKLDYKTTPSNVIEERELARVTAQHAEHFADKNIPSTEYLKELPVFPMLPYGDPCAILEEKKTVIEEQIKTLPGFVADYYLDNKLIFDFVHDANTEAAYDALIHHVFKGTVQKLPYELHEVKYNSYICEDSFRNISDVPPPENPDFSKYIFPNEAQIIRHTGIERFDKHVLGVVIEANMNYQNKYMCRFATRANIDTIQFVDDNLLTLEACVLLLIQKPDLLFKMKKSRRNLIIDIISREYDDKNKDSILVQAYNKVVKAWNTDDIEIIIVPEPVHRGEDEPEPIPEPEPDYPIKREFVSVKFADETLLSQYAEAIPKYSLPTLSKTVLSRASEIIGLFTRQQESKYIYIYQNGNLSRIRKEYVTPENFVTLYCRNYISENYSNNKYYRYSACYSKANDTKSNFLRASSKIGNGNVIACYRKENKIAIYIRKHFMTDGNKPGKFSTFMKVFF